VRVACTRFLFFFFLFFTNLTICSLLSLICSLLHVLLFLCVGGWSVRARTCIVRHFFLCAGRASRSRWFLMALRERRRSQASEGAAGEGSGECGGNSESGGIGGRWRRATSASEGPHELLAYRKLQEASKSFFPHKCYSISEDADLAERLLACDFFDNVCVALFVLLQTARITHTHHHLFIVLYITGRE